MWAGGGQYIRVRTNTCLLLFVHIHVLLYLYVCRVYSLLFVAAVFSPRPSLNSTFGIQLYLVCFNKLVISFNSF